MIFRSFDFFANIQVKTHNRLWYTKCLDMLREVEMWLYPGCEVYSSSSVQQQGGDIHITIVSRDVQRGEPTLFQIDKERGGKESISEERSWDKKRKDQNNGRNSR